MQGGHAVMAKIMTYETCHFVFLQMAKLLLSFKEVKRVFHYKDSVNNESRFFAKTKICDPLRKKINLATYPHLCVVSCSFHDFGMANG